MVSKEKRREEPLRNNSGIGLTLIEMVTVIVIIGILVTIALPQYQRVVRRSRWLQAISAVDTIHKAMKTYYYTRGAWPTNPVSTATCAEINTYLQNMGVYFVQVPDIACNDYAYKLYCNTPAVCTGAGSAACSVIAWKKSTAGNCAAAQAWGIRKLLETDELRFSTDPAFYP